MNAASAWLVARCDAGGRARGVAAAAALALAASWIAGGLGDPLARNPVLVAMLSGLLAGAAFGCPVAWRPGLDFTRRTLLRVGVALLGLRTTGALLADLGPVPIAIAAAELAIVLVSVRWVARRVFGLDGEFALLVAVGSAVCGAAAILSFSTMMRSRDQRAGHAIAVITLAGTAALLAYPVAFLGGWMPGLDERGFGITVGASIFELAQVYGASYAVSEGALNIATLVKLSKVAMLVPLVLAYGACRPRDASEGTDGARGRLQVPWFVAGFLAVLAFNSTVAVPPALRQAVLAGDQFLFLMVTAALGLTTPLGQWGGLRGAARMAGTAVFALACSAAVAWGLTTLFAQPRSTQAASPVATLGVGARLFDDVGCGKCHVPALRGVRGDVLLYSDLLLHDMGPALDDKIVQGEALGSEWRTTPLVGLGTHDRFLHDARAASLRDAILAHGGEAEIVRRRFFELDEREQADVLKFLRSL